MVDELDGLFRERDGEDYDVGRNLKMEFLQLWDGVRDCLDDKRGGSLILVIGARIGRLTSFLPLFGNASQGLHGAADYDT